MTFAVIEPASVPSTWEISFSTMWQAENCPKQVAYDRSGGLRDLLQAPNLAGLLGNAAHSMLRDMGPGRVTSESFDAQWSRRLERLRSGALRPSIGSLPPPEAWPNYWVTYERLRIRLVDDSANEVVGLIEPGNLRAAESVATTFQLPLVERTLHDSVAHIVGTPDLVYKNSQDEVCIRDYKTGATPSPQREAAQLHLYAHLITCAGFDPTWGEIDRLRGTPERQPIKAEMVEGVLDRVHRARKGVIEHSTSPSTPEDCTQCAYSLICSESRAVEAATSKSVHGKVSATIYNADGTVAGLRVESGEGEVVIGGLDHRALVAVPGERVLALGLRRRSVGTGLLADWATVVVTEKQINDSLRLTAVGDDAPRAP